MKRILLGISALLVTLSSFAQISWDPIIDVAASGNGNNYPRVVINNNSDAIVSWGSSENLMIARWTGTAFSTPLQVNPGGVTIAEQTWQGPDIASSGTNVYAVYKETPEADAASKIWCVTSTDGGVSFGSPVQVDWNLGADGSRFPTVTTDDSGNPIVAFMRFDTGFTNARYVVGKSADVGATFSVDTIASGWSSGTSEVCDCCPATIVSSSNVVAMMYRDNDSDIRDSWVGFSTDTATSFTSGINVDQQAWNLNSCPSSGPDGVIVGDTLITTFMNGASGQSTVYFNKTSISSPVGTAGTEATGVITGLQQQNYPRISNYGNAVGIVWRQTISGQTEIALRFAENVETGLPSYDTVATDYITNTDIAVGDGQIHIVWQNNIAGTVKYLHGTFGTSVGIDDTESKELDVYPNPSSSVWNVDIAAYKNSDAIQLTDLSGKIILQGTTGDFAENGLIILDNKNLAIGAYSLSISSESVKHTSTLVKN